MKKSIDLKEWCEQYIRSRDAMERKLVKLEHAGDAIVVQYKDRLVTWLPMNTLEVPLRNEGHITIVCLQNQQNFNMLVNEFQSFAKNSNLTIMFLNPQLHEKWMLKPGIHASVADKTTLKSGLQTLYQTVPPV